MHRYHPSGPRLFVLAHAIAALTIGVASQTHAQTVERIVPSSTDPRITHFDDDHVVIADAGPTAPLVVFLPGTGGKPQNVVPLLSIVAAQGYRAIGLAYNDEPAVSQVCPRDPNPACSAAFREMRSFGDGAARVDNPPAEAIVARLASLLAALERLHPADGWNTYRQADGTPAWDRIVLSGLSQGAGMAAFIAQRVAVRRVVLFSSPWDTTGADRHPAPWLSAPSATPIDRWWAERHARENTTELIANAYAALGIPADHIVVFDRSLTTAPRTGGNPYHGSTVRDVGYAPEWRLMFGDAR